MPTEQTPTFSHIINNNNSKNNSSNGGNIPTLVRTSFTAIRTAIDDEQRTLLAATISNLVASYAREISNESFSKFMQHDVNKRIFALIHSPEVQHKLAGIVVIDSLIDFQGEDNTAKTTRFANYLRIVLPGNDPQISIFAAKALGRLSKPGGTLAAEFVEFEVKRALEWLQAEENRNEAKRFAAITVLKELTISSPTLIFSDIPQILDLLWTALHDPKVNIRDCGAEVLSTCLQLMHKRESHFRRLWYGKIYDTAEQGLASSLNPDSLHGYLLVQRQLFLHAGRFMDQEYLNASAAIIRLHEHNNALIRKTVIKMYPVLADYNPIKFVEFYLSICITSLIQEIKSSGRSEYQDRKEQAFLAIGQVAKSINLSILPFLDTIFGVIKDDLKKG
ncbi:phosphatidylinositol kinase- protein kinase tor1, partial [Physocladia obscura]